MPGGVTAVKDFHNKEWEKAIKEITLAINRDRSKPEYYHLRSMANHWLEKNDEALTDIESTLILDPGALELATAKLHFLQLVNKEQEAIRFYGAWLKNIPAIKIMMTTTDIMNEANR